MQWNTRGKDKVLYSTLCMILYYISRFYGLHSTNAQIPSRSNQYMTLIKIWVKCVLKSIVTDRQNFTILQRSWFFVKYNFFPTMCTICIHIHSLSQFFEIRISRIGFLAKRINLITIFNYILIYRLLYRKQCWLICR